MNIEYTSKSGLHEIDHITVSAKSLVFILKHDGYLREPLKRLHPTVLFGLRLKEYPPSQEMSYTFTRPVVTLHDGDQIIVEDRDGLNTISLLYGLGFDEIEVDVEKDHADVVAWILQ
jgi:hypothetical protein